MVIRLAEDPFDPAGLELRETEKLALKDIDVAVLFLVDCVLVERAATKLDEDNSAAVAFLLYRTTA